MCSAAKALSQWHKLASCKIPSSRLVEREHFCAFIFASLPTRREIRLDAPELIDLYRSLSFPGYLKEQSLIFLQGGFHIPSLCLKHCQAGRPPQETHFIFFKWSYLIQTLQQQRLRLALSQTIRHLLMLACL